MIALARKGGASGPAARSAEKYVLPLEDLEPLSVIIADLNERFGVSLGPQHRLTLAQMMASLEDEDSALDASARRNILRENLRLASSTRSMT